MIEPPAPDSPRPHPAINQVVGAYLALADAARPGLIEGMYLVGSVALGDFHPHTSDIDFIAVTTNPLSRNDLAALSGVHRTLRLRIRRPFLDGLYVTWSDLADHPALSGPGGDAHEGTLRPRERCGDMVAWHTLAARGHTVRGPAARGLDVWTSREALVRWTRQNMDEYWKRLRHRAGKPASLWSLACMSPWGPPWAVLGVARQHYTITTGQITSKSGAGHHARGAFGPRWHRIVDESLRLRAGGAAHSLYATPLARRRDTLSFMDTVFAAVETP